MTAPMKMSQLVPPRVKGMLAMETVCVRFGRGTGLLSGGAAKAVYSRTPSRWAHVALEVVQLSL